MENKIQALADKLYQDGLGKGKEEGERLLAQAKEQARQLQDEARRKADEIIEKARKEAEDLKNNALTEIKITSRQMIATLKKEVEEQLMGKVVDPGVRSAMEQQQFMQELILKAVSAFASGSQAPDLRLILPESDQAAYDAFLRELTGNTLKEGLSVSFSGDMQGGFKIENRAGGYLLSFTEEDFLALFKEYARPKLKQLLF
ncbi:MAG: hypothetical protein NC396_02255 [Bacteroides sp.]|nr:hypothetical protein [Bacteroides sp.]MCM1085012.1 hypothetical protein [Bacteroides sp.]